MLIGEQGLDFVINDGKKFDKYPKQDCHFLAFSHSGKPRKPISYQVVGVCIDSIKTHLKQPLLKLQRQSNVEMFYLEGVAQKSGKNIEKEYVKDFDFYTMAEDNTKDQIEIETLEIRIREEQSRYDREIQLIQSEISDLE